MAINPGVQEGLEKTERERSYRVVKSKLEILQKQFKIKILESLGAGVACTFIPPACIAIASAFTGVTPVMAISPFLAGAGFGTAVAVAGITTAVLTDKKDIRKLKQEELRYNPKERERADKELEEEVTKNLEYQEIKEQNNEFLNLNEKNIEKSMEDRRAQTTAKINATSNLNQPEEKFDPKAVVKTEKVDEEKLAEEKRKEALMAILSAGPTFEDNENERNGKSR